MSKYPVGCPTPAPNTLQYLSEVVMSNHYSMGKWVARLESEFAAKFGYENAVACNNGTSALHLALLALGIGVGDEVIVPATTFVATANVVKYVGATPVICDVDKDTWNLDLERLKNIAQRYGTRNTKAVIWVHLYGNSSGISAVSEFCKAHDLALIEDCAEAIGARENKQPIGTIGSIAAFSFYGNKTITTGEGGMVVTRHKSLAEKVRFYRGQAQDANLRFWHTDVGYNYRMTEFQAAPGVAQLEIVDDLLEKRRILDTLYRRLLHGKVTFQRADKDCTPGYWAFGCLLSTGINVEKVKAQLELMGIETRRFFYPLNALPMYKDCAPVSTPVAIDIFNRGLWLPLHAELSIADVKFICESLLEVLERAEIEQETFDSQYS